ncbi:MAG: site-2 protease family protein, partial [Planctomycetota bacterium]
MFGRSVRLFRIFGFSVKIDLSWFIILVLITWSLAEGLFPLVYEDLPRATLWLMGLAGALGLFASIVFHELAHSLVARRYGLAIRGITLFVFGGVSEMEEEPASAGAEFMMAIAGPLSSLVLSGTFYGLSVLGMRVGVPGPVIGVAAYVAIMNFVLAVFNLLPGFPLDGGRVLRSILWYWKGDLRWATGVAAGVGKGFGLALVALGVMNLVLGSLVAGMWWLLIGLFLRSAAEKSYRQLVVRQELEGKTVRRFMDAQPVKVVPWATVDTLIRDYAYKHHQRMFPVAENGNLFGCVDLRRLKSLPISEWGRHAVLEFTQPCTPENSITPEEGATEALARMGRSRTGRLLVVEDSKLVGVIAMRDVMQFLSLKLELG